MWVQDLSNRNEPPPIQFSPFIGSGERRWPRWRLGGAAQRRQPRLGAAAALARNVKAAAAEALVRRSSSAAEASGVDGSRLHDNGRPPFSAHGLHRLPFRRHHPPRQPLPICSTQATDATPPASLAFSSPPQAPSLCDPLAIFDTVAASRSSGSPSHHRP
uniref:Uncharacterized protein n=1 Tax=Oryza meridionalis TaxID=40149 RepID=A0A0E0DUD3_9ORYZ